MTRPQKEEALRSAHLLKENDTFTKIIQKNRFFLYKLSLFFHDFLIINLVFGFGVWLTGVGYSIGENSSIHLVYIIFSIVFVAFFITYDLYSYHFIFLIKRHMLGLVKAIVWGFVTLLIVSFLYTYPMFLENTVVLLSVFISSIILLLLSRFFGNHISNIILSLGLGILIIGFIKWIPDIENSMTLTNGFEMFLCLTLSLTVFIGSRLLLVHEFFNELLRSHFRRQVVIIGSNRDMEKITNHVVECNAPFYVSGFLGTQENVDLDLCVTKVRLGDLKMLPTILEELRINEVIITDEEIDKQTLIPLFYFCATKGITVWIPPKLMPIINLKINIDTFCGIPMIRLCSQKNSYIFSKIKHGLDAIIVAPMMLLISPLFLIIAAAIKLTSHGPVFYKARAVGKNERKFTMYKFRSMFESNDHENHKDFVCKFINGEICYENVKEGTFKITDDDRVTSIGKLLRKLSLDELPQLINVLKGDMSLVGPRPCLPYECEVYKEWHKARLSIRPGITGVWQVAGRSAVTFEDMVLLDLYYVYNRSLLMDLRILYETIFVVLEKRGAH